MRIHAVLEPSDPHRDLLRDAVGHLTFGRPVPDSVDVLVCGRPTQEELDALNRGGTLVIPYAGVPQGTLEGLQRRSDVRVFNLHHNAELVAEHAVALLLAASRRVVVADRELRSGDWRRRYLPDDSPQLRGHRAVIAGYGAIGRAVATALEGLGMRVATIRRTDGLAAMDPLLPAARALIVALPHTPLTEGAFDAARLARLPAEAVVVNVARGPIIDEEALYEALATGRIYGAALDVWWRYPDGEDARSSTPPAELPFHELHNVVLSPHRAGHALETEEHRIAHLATLLGALARGEQPPHRVDLDRGY